MAPRSISYVVSDSYPLATDNPFNDDTANQRGGLATLFEFGHRVFVAASQRYLRAMAIRLAMEEGDDYAMFLLYHYIDVVNTRISLGQLSLPRFVLRGLDSLRLMALGRVISGIRNRLEFRRRVPVEDESRIRVQLHAKMEFRNESSDDLWSLEEESESDEGPTPNHEAGLGARQMNT